MKILSAAPIDDRSGVDIPENVYTPPTEEQQETKTGAFDRAHQIVEDLVGNNAFAVAREIAIQTYTNAWFLSENDVLFKVALASKLHHTFNIDGFVNDVWAKLVAKDI